MIRFFFIAHNGGYITPYTPMSFHILQKNSEQWLKKKSTSRDEHLQVSFLGFSFLTIFDIFYFVFITFLFWTPPPYNNTVMCHCTCEIRFRKGCKGSCVYGLHPLNQTFLKAHSWKVWLRFCAIYTLLYLNKENIQYDWVCIYRQSFQWVSINFVQVSVHVLPFHYIFVHWSRNFIIIIETACVGIYQEFPIVYK